MKLPPPSPVREARRDRRAAAFTLVEIAISLAVIAFALVAIIGVLPTGMQVQRDNREETIINQEANYFANAIRSGARGLDDLTNAVAVIENHWTEYKVTLTTTNAGASGTDRYTTTNSAVTLYPVPATFAISDGYRIVGLLSTPKYLPQGGGFLSNHIAAYVRALSGPASEKFPQDNQDVRADAFTYRLICENQPLPAWDVGSAYGKNLLTNLHELRLIFRYPLKSIPENEKGRQVFRLQVGGLLLPVIDTSYKEPPFYFFQPTTFVKAP
ncbi:MAG: hypothetical protein EXS35_11395 [Pedosphaera sp.]|nr:hypothetical protein [Pedosphaera sp.]